MCVYCLTMNTQEKIELPYFLALFQGEEFIINAKVNRLSAMPETEFGYIEIVWIKCEEKEWTIDLDKQMIECKNGADKFYRTIKLDRQITPVRASNNRADHTKYFINTIFGTIEVISFKRQIYPLFNKDFFDKYKNFNDCIGALISKDKIEYIDGLYSIII